MRDFRASCRERIYASIEVKRFDEIDQHNKTTTGALYILVVAWVLRLLGDAEYYNAARAKKLVRYEHGERSEAGYFWEDLYRSGYGRYFLNCFGGARDGSLTCQIVSELLHLTPLSKEAAHSWVQVRFGTERLAGILDHNP